MKFTRPSHGDQCPVCTDVCATLDATLAALEGIGAMVPAGVDPPRVVQCHILAAVLGWSARLLLAHGYEVSTIIEALEEMSDHGTLNPAPTPRH